MGLFDNSQDPFENFRREKKMRALQRELQRRMESRQGQILKLIEQEERTEVLERRIQREMRDFFEDSTKLAASVLAEVAEQKAREISAQITKEMQEFFREVLLRAERTIQGIRIHHPRDEQQEELETHLDPSLSEAFGGRPREKETPPQTSRPVGAGPSPGREEITPEGREEKDLRSHQAPSVMEEDDSSALAGEVYVPEPEEDSSRDGVGEVQVGEAEEEEEPFLPDERVEEEDEEKEDMERMKAILQGLSRNPKKLKEALTALFRAGVIDKEEARSLYSTYSKS